VEDAQVKRWQHIQPGDIGFDRGVGLSGFLIRLGTRSQYAHCWVYHKPLPDGRWVTVEAGPRKGVVWRVREVAPNLVIRTWRNPHQQEQVLAASRRMLGKRYGWGEILRICLYMVGVKLKTTYDNPNRVICSNHVAQAVLAPDARIANHLRYPHYAIWPGALAQDLTAWDWWDRYGWKQAILNR
jgi:hypothetical protein